MRGNSAGWRRLRWLNHWQKLKYNRVRKLRVNRAKILNGSVWTKYPVKFFSQLEIRPVSYERSTWLQANTLSICNVSTNWHIVRAKRSKCIMQKWGLHEALPKRQFKNIMVFFEAAIWDVPQLQRGRNCLKAPSPGRPSMTNIPRGNTQLGKCLGVGGCPWNWLLSLVILMNG